MSRVDAWKERGHNGYVVGWVCAFAAPMSALAGTWWLAVFLSLMAVFGCVDWAVYTLLRAQAVAKDSAGSLPDTKSEG